MEAFGADIAEMRTELRSHDSRISSIHGRLGEVQVEQATQKTEIKVLSKEVDEAREDIRDANKKLDDLDTKFDKKMGEMQDGFDKKFESLTNAVKWGTMAMIGLIGVLLPLLLK